MLKLQVLTTSPRYDVISFSFKRLNALMWKELMNVNAKMDTMIYLDQILFKGEFVQVSGNLLQPYDVIPK